MVIWKSSICALLVVIVSICPPGTARAGAEVPGTRGRTPHPLQKCSGKNICSCCLKIFAVVLLTRVQGVDGVADVGEVRHGAAQDRGAGAAVVVRQTQPALPQDETNEDSCNIYIYQIR